ncbi:MAG: hypothetical protein ACI9R3_004728, partial [Verrucomicrobiales bacterium]
ATSFTQDDTCKSKAFGGNQYERKAKKPIREPEWRVVELVTYRQNTNFSRGAPGLRRKRGRNRLDCR